MKGGGGALALVALGAGALALLAFSGDAGASPAGPRVLPPGGGEGPDEHAARRKRELEKERGRTVTYNEMMAEDAAMLDQILTSVAGSENPDDLRLAAAALRAHPWNTTEFRSEAYAIANDLESTANDIEDSRNRGAESPWENPGAWV